jgi:hypothetical protein
MKALAIIWLAVVVSGIFTINYVSHALDALVIRPLDAYQVQPAEAIDLGNNVCLQACNEPNIQPAKGL